MSEVEHRDGRSGGRSFTLREILFLVAIAALLLGWWLDRKRWSANSLDVIGPVNVTYTESTPNYIGPGTSKTINNAVGLQFSGDSVIVHTSTGGIRLDPEKVTDLQWQKP